jgi:hypothetical protein
MTAHFSTAPLRDRHLHDRVRVSGPCCRAVLLIYSSRDSRFRIHRELDRSLPFVMNCNRAAGLEVLDEFRNYMIWHAVLPGSLHKLSLRDHSCVLWRVVFGVQISQQGLQIRIGDLLVIRVQGHNSDKSGT